MVHQHMWEHLGTIVIPMKQMYAVFSVVKIIQLKSIMIIVLHTNLRNLIIIYVLSLITMCSC